MSHLMIIGGTGMLGGVVLEFARRGWTVSVLARRAETIGEPGAGADSILGRVVPLVADYTRSSQFVARLRARVDELGVPSVVVAWIHRTAPDAPRLAARALSAAAEDAPVEFIHVLSRLRTGDPRDRTVAAREANEAELRSIPGLRYRQVILGWIVEPSGSRWLRDGEIARGVIEAIDSGSPLVAIGQIEPIESNPDAAG